MSKPPKNANKSKSPSQKSRVGSVVTPEVLDASELDEADLTDDDQEGLDDESDAEIEGQFPVEAGDDAEEPASVTSLVPDGISPHQKDLLKRYMDEVVRYPLLNLEEEFALAAKLKATGDIEAARQLVRANLRLVVKIAMEYRSTYQNILDLIQEGNIGLMKAVSKFDPSKGAKLSYYASWWIRSYILKYILDNFRLIRVGTTQAQKKLFFHLMREKERLEAQGLDAGPKLLADRLHVREKDVIEMEQRLSGRGVEMSLSSPAGGANDEESKATHMDLLEDSHAIQDEVLAHHELQEILSSHLDDFAKTLKEKELAVFRDRLVAEEPKTLQEIADKFGLTRERARQIEARVIEKLREYYKKYLG